MESFWKKLPWKDGRRQFCSKGILCLMSGIDFFPSTQVTSCCFLALLVLHPQAQLLPPYLCFTVLPKPDSIARSPVLCEVSCNKDDSH